MVGSGEWKGLEWAWCFRERLRAGMADEKGGGLEAAVEYCCGMAMTTDYS